MAGFSQTESTVDGLRVRATTWTDRSGWRHESRVETRLDQNGTPIRNEDGSIPIGQSTILRAPLGFKMTFTCVGQIAFNRQGDSTEVILSHDHKVVGGTRFNRRHLQRSDEERQPEDFRNWIDRCQDACCVVRSQRIGAEGSPERPVLSGVADWTAMKASEDWPQRLLATSVVEADHEIISAFLDDEVPAAELPLARVETDFRAKTVAVSFPVGLPPRPLSAGRPSWDPFSIVQNVRGV